MYSAADVLQLVAVSLTLQICMDEAGGAGVIFRVSSYSGRELWIRIMFSVSCDIIQYWTYVGGVLLGVWVTLASSPTAFHISGIPLTYLDAPLVLGALIQILQNINFCLEKISTLKKLQKLHIFKIVFKLSIFHINCQTKLPF